MNKEANIILEGLKRTLIAFDETSAQRKLDAIQKCSQLKLSDPKFIEQYHNALLFVLGYSEYERIYSAAQNEMFRISEAVKKLPDHKRKS